MRLHELTLHNVGVYAGKQTIDLRTTPDRPVVLVGGYNGCGKTTLLDAMQLCLYGNRARTAGRGALGYETYLRGLISKGVNPADGASIQLRFSVRVEGDDRHYRVSRAWNTAGQDNLSVREFVSVFIDEQIDPGKSDGWADHVEDLLPLELSSLFLFDGEKVKELADPTTAATVIRTAVNSLLGVGSLEQLRTDLVTVRNRQTPAGEDPALREEINKLLARMGQLQTDRDGLVQKRGEVFAARARAADELDAAEQAFAAQGGDFYTHRTQLQAQADRIRAELATAEAGLRDLAEGPLPLMLLAGPARALAKAARSSAEAATNQLLVDQISERDEWLLTLLSPDQAELIAPELARNRAVMASACHYRGITFDGETHTRVESASAAAAYEAKRARADLATHQTLRAQLDAVLGRLGRVPESERIADLIDKRERAAHRVAGLDGALEVIDGDMRALDSTRSEVSARLAAAEAARREQLAETDYNRRVLESIERVRDTLARLRAHQITAHVRKVEVAALESFTKLMRKKGLVADLTIDPTSFALTLRDAAGEEIRAGSLSAGESQILAISLLWGLARVAGRPMPTVVDTPLGRLDSGNRQLLVDRYFPAASTQVLLLSTDEEIDANLYRRLLPHTARAYLLEHDDPTGVTTIRPGFWWDQEGSHVA